MTKGTQPLTIYDSSLDVYRWEQSEGKMEEVRWEEKLERKKDKKRKIGVENESMRESKRKEKRIKKPNRWAHSHTHTHPTHFSSLSPHSLAQCLLSSCLLFEDCRGCLYLPSLLLSYPTSRVALADIAIMPTSPSTGCLLDPNTPEIYTRMWCCIQEPEP